MNIVPLHLCCPVMKGEQITFGAVAQKRTCKGTAISAAMNPQMPRKKLFRATADEERPTLASTM